MVLFAGDQRELVLPLQNGFDEDPPFATFLARLRARTGAQHALLLAGQPGSQGPAMVEQALERGRNPLTPDHVNETIPLPINALRPDRVYALAELTLGDNLVRATRRTAFGLIHGRLMRVVPRGDLNAWLLLFHETIDFTAADSALLSALGPHLAAAIDLRARFDALHLRAAMAEEALGRLGIAQAALAGDGRVVASDPAYHLPRTTTPLAEAVASDGPRLVGSGDDAVFVRPISVGERALPLPARAVAAVRAPRRNNRAAAAALLAKLHGLSPREAALADALSRGDPLVEAGVALGLTPETARNYSKRIYAKTGTVGQADLVRLVLDGLAVLA